jgi:hypothetical protein
VEVFFPFVP